MDATSLFSAVLLLTALSYLAGFLRAGRMARTFGRANLHSLPGYYGAMTALWCLLPAILLLAAWQLSEPAILKQMVFDFLPAEAVPASLSEQRLILSTIHNIADGAVLVTEPVYQDAAVYLQEIRDSGRFYRSLMVLALANFGAILAWLQIRQHKRARNHVESILKSIFIGCSMVAILTTLGIVMSVVSESIRFFQYVPLWEFLTGLHWSPQTAIRADQVGSSGSFGAVPLFVGTLQISFMAMCVAVPVGLFSAIYLSEYASKRLRAIAKPTLEILAGVPTVVYGFFAALTVAPAIRDWANAMGFAASSESALAAGVVMGVMIIPFVSSLSDDVINAVPQTLRDGSYGLGATRSETITKVIIPAALPGIVGGILLAVSRAIGETMIVVMAAGMAANLTANPLESVTTVTVQIVTLLVGDQEFDSPKTLSAFALGLMLFLVTLTLNAIALWVVNRYREQYE